MRNNDREDLTYLLPLIEDPTHHSLAVLSDREGDDLAFSFCARPAINGPWYAVKWGATPAGRERTAGVACLIGHISHLHRTAPQQRPFVLDFWGRRSEIYDQLRNTSVQRLSVTIARPPRR